MRYIWGFSCVTIVGANAGELIEKREWNAD